MSIPGLTDDERRRLLITCVDLPFLPDSRVSSDYISCLLETVLNFHLQTTVVEKGLTYFRDHVQHRHDIYEHGQLEGWLKTFPDTEDGNREAARSLWNNALWTRVECLRRLMVYFRSIGVTDLATLLRWARSADFERDFKGKVKGLGIAVFHWLLIRCGVSSIKPDVWVLNFVERVVGRRLPEKTVVDLFAWLSPFLGHPMEVIDLTIWYYERAGMATNDSPPLRVAFWNLLRDRLETRIRDDPFLNALGWECRLDEPHQLRYDIAGLTMAATRSLFGNDRQETGIKVHQSLWCQGLGLRLTYWQASEAPEKLLAKTQAQYKEFDWRVRNDSIFEATVDLGGELRMPSLMTIEELKGRVERIEGRVVESIRFWCE